MRTYPRSVSALESPTSRMLQTVNLSNATRLSPGAKVRISRKFFLVMNVHRRGPVDLATPRLLTCSFVLARVTSLCDPTDASVLLRGCATKYGTCQPREYEYLFETRTHRMSACVAFCIVPSYLSSKGRLGTTSLTRLYLS